MKIKSSFEKKSTRLYNNFWTYEDAEYNIPHVAGILSKSIIGRELFNFNLGKHTFNELSKVTNSSTASECLGPFLTTLVIFLYTCSFNLYMEVLLQCVNLFKNWNKTLYWRVTINDYDIKYNFSTWILWILFFLVLFFLCFCFLWESSVYLHFQELLSLDIMKCERYFLGITTTRTIMIGSIFWIISIWNTWNRITFTGRSVSEYFNLVYLTKFPYKWEDTCRIV